MPKFKAFVDRIATVSDKIKIVFEAENKIDASNILENMIAEDDVEGNCAAEVAEIVDSNDITSGDHEYNILTLEPITQDEDEE